MADAPFLQCADPFALSGLARDADARPYGGVPAALIPDVTPLQRLEWGDITSLAVMKPRETLRTRVIPTEFQSASKG
jgi:hypothetical protein